jgi:hypothetical protein
MRRAAAYHAAASLGVPLSDKRFAWSFSQAQLPPFFTHCRERCISVLLCLEDMREIRRGGLQLMRTRFASYLVAMTTLILAGSGAAFAHHGSGVSYNMAKMVTMEGTVTEFRWRNPHVYVLYDVKGDDAKVTNWGAETHSPVVCENDDGWDKNTLKPGDKITISIFPSQIATPRGLLAKIVFNGKVIIDDVSRGRAPAQ